MSMRASVMAFGWVLASGACAASGAASAASEPSAEKRVGTASLYARSLSGKKMADGTPLDPHDAVAASKTLPLGSRARVTNLANGKSTVVKITDRGPYAKGRIVDLSPAAADKVGLTRKKGTARVEVAPLK
ncbi:MAG: septal ring lytic transglycosylase RlpA family protein [Pseudomonadota bacterium]|nr:septal ring lytic transglycosylase RlpA family protein [Pseudomonadota bacterium]